MADVQPPSSVLLVGSVPLSTTHEVFTKICAALPGRLYALPDGEVGERGNFIRWQLPRFPLETIRYELGGIEPNESALGHNKVEAIQPTEYDVAAIASYAEFVQLRERNLIPHNIRFQICLPTPLNSILGHIRPEFHEQLEPLYEQRYHEALVHILNKIPASDLVVQWDLCFDVMALEYETGTVSERFKAPFSPVMQGVLHRLSRVCNSIPLAVPLAFHLCYGDLRHKHFVEPADSGLLVRLANEIVRVIGEGDKHTIEWIHMPVPRDRNDAAYFEPLKALDLRGARLYLGLVHANDEKGTRAKIHAARSVYRGDLGVATECGMGRTPPEELDSILTISEAVTKPRGLTNV